MIYVGFSGGLDVDVGEESARVVDCGWAGAAGSRSGWVALLLRGVTHSFPVVSEG